MIEEEVYQNYYDEYLEIENVLKDINNDDNYSFMEYIDLYIKSYELQRKNIEDKIDESVKVLKKNKLMKQIGIASLVTIVGSNFDTNNLYSFVFPGTIYISLKAKEDMEHKKYSLCKTKYGYNIIYINLYYLLKLAFIGINFLAIYEMKNYYDDDIKGFETMLALIIIGVAIKINNKKDYELAHSIRMNQVDKKLCEEKLNQLYNLKNYEEKGESYVKRRK